MGKPNAFLSALEAKHRQQTKMELAAQDEIDRIALLMAANDFLRVGPGRAGGFLFAFIEKKMELVNRIDEDFGDDKKSGDKELLQLKRELGTRIKEILSPEDWKLYQHMFPMLRDYWEE